MILPFHYIDSRKVRSFNETVLSTRTSGLDEDLYPGSGAWGRILWYLLLLLFSPSPFILLLARSQEKPVAIGQRKRRPSPHALDMRWPISHGSPGYKLTTGSVVRHLSNLSITFSVTHCLRESSDPRKSIFASISVYWVIKPCMIISGPQALFIDFLNVTMYSPSEIF